MGLALTADDIAELRVIDRIEITGGKGQLVCAGGRIFALSFDHLIDLVQSVETINARLTGKMLSAKCRPAITPAMQAAADKAKVKAGGADLYDGELGEAAQHFGHWMRVEIGDTITDSWFVRLDELIKCLWSILRDNE